MHVRCLWDTAFLHCVHNAIASHAFEMNNTIILDLKARAIPLVFGIALYAALLRYSLGHIP